MADGGGKARSCVWKIRGDENDLIPKVAQQSEEEKCLIHNFAQQYEDVTGLIPKLTRQSEE